MLKIETELNGITTAEAYNLLQGPQSDDCLLHSGRNTIWRTEILGHQTAVKRFADSVLRSIIYACRSSKAQRSFTNALELRHRGINTPEPIAYIEKRETLNRLTASIYISAYEKSSSLEQTVKQDKTVMIEFARFVAKLHEAGIRHDDLNATNVRVRGEVGNRQFSLIDLNRMKIYPPGIPVPLNECFDNVTRFSNFSPDFCNFIRAYIKSRHLKGCAEQAAYEAKRRHDKSVDRIKRIKRILMPLKKKYRSR